MQEIDVTIHLTVENTGGFIKTELVFLVQKLHNNKFFKDFFKLTYLAFCQMERYYNH